MECNKFEKLFVQETQEELLKHIKSCSSCKLEYEKMLATERLIKEVKPYFIAQGKKQTYAKIAASFGFIVILSAVVFQKDFNNGYVGKVSYDESISIDLPVDEYGLLSIE